MGAVLCRVCRAAQAWVLPLLYTTVVLSTSTDIQQFAEALTVREVPAKDVAVTPSPALFVRNLWMGPASSNASYGKEKTALSRTSQWPQGDLCRILQRCKSLRTLALIDLPQGAWSPLCVPKSVEALWLGPSHAKVEWSYLLCAPRLAHFVSVDTFLFDSEFESLLCRAAGIQQISRYLRCAETALHALGRVVDTPADSKLETIEVVCCAEERGGLSMFLEDEEDSMSYKVKRHMLTLTMKSALRDGRPDFLALVFEDWLASLKT